MIRGQHTYFRTPNRNRIISAFSQIISRRSHTIRARHFIRQHVNTKLNRIFLSRITHHIVHNRPFQLRNNNMIFMATIRGHVTMHHMKINHTVSLQMPIVANRRFVDTLTTLRRFTVFNRFTKRRVRNSTIVTSRQLTRHPRHYQRLLSSFFFISTRLIILNTMVLNSRIQVLGFITTLTTNVLRASKGHQRIFRTSFARRASRRTQVSTTKRRRTSVSNHTLAGHRHITNTIRRTIAPIFRHRIRLINIETMKRNPPNFLFNDTVDFGTRPNH